MCLQVCVRARPAAKCFCWPRQRWRTSPSSTAWPVKSSCSSTPFTSCCRPAETGSASTRRTPKTRCWSLRSQAQQSTEATAFTAVILYRSVPLPFTTGSQFCAKKLNLVRLIIGEKKWCMSSYIAQSLVTNMTWCFNPDRLWQSLPICRFWSNAPQMSWRRRVCAQNIHTPVDAGCFYLCPTTSESYTCCVQESSSCCCCWMRSRHPPVHRRAPHASVFNRKLPSHWLVSAETRWSLRPPYSSGVRDKLYSTVTQLNNYKCAIIALDHRM